MALGNCGRGRQQYPEKGAATSQHGADISKVSPGEHFTCMNSLNSLPTAGAGKDAGALKVWGETGLKELQICETR